MTQRDDVLARLRRDPRVDLVARGLLAAQLGLTVDDLPLLRDATVAELLRLPSAVSLVVGAHRLLGELDAQLARAHPVDLEFHGPITVVTVPVGEDDATRVVLEAGTVHLPYGATSSHNPLSEEYSVDDAESLAYALLRLVAVAREDDPPTDDSDPDPEN